MPEKTFTPRVYYDFISEFSLGMNQGIQPILLKKDQAANLNGGTVRGAFISNRPPKQQLTLNYNGNTALKDALETGIFQGAQYYRPDFGPIQLVISVSGRLFSITMVATTGTVAEITIPGDPNSASATQTWMWQSEKWMIINDGSGKLPIFYDGVSSRRSYGASVLIGTATSEVGGTGSPPSVGQDATFNVTINPAYTGPLSNIPVLFNGEYYEIVGGGGGNPQVVLTNVSAVPGENIPANSNIVVNASNLGNVTVSGVWQNGIVVNKLLASIVISSNLVSEPNQNVVINGTTYGMTDFSGNGTTASFHLITAFDINLVGKNAVPTGSLVQLSSGSQPSVIVAVTAQPFTNSPVGQSNTVNVVAPYTGAAGQIVTIGTDQYTIAAVADGPPTGTLTFLNNSDTSTTPYAFPLPIFSEPELPAGRMGAYGLGQNWFSLTDGISFEAGDVVGGPSGTAAYNYRDSVLKTTENDFLTGGGTFRLPGTGNIITAMVFTAQLDASLGQGNLQVGSAEGFFGVDATGNRANWINLTTPILAESMIGFGPLSQNATITGNSDVYFRSYNGIGSLIIARRDFGNQQLSGGNTPISREVQDVIDADNVSLLSYGSAVVFDNRLLKTASPTQTGNGVYWGSLLAMNLDPLSNLQVKLPAVYDGVWPGYNVLQIIVAEVNGLDRCFLLVLNTASNRIELWEQQKTKDGTADNGTIPIQTQMETSVVFNADVKPTTDLMRLLDAELFVRDIVGNVAFQVDYRPDWASDYTPWRSFTLSDKFGTYRGPLAMGEPSSDTPQTANNRPTNFGYIFQVRVTFTGSCKFMAMRFAGVSVAEPYRLPPVQSDAVSS